MTNITQEWVDLQPRSERRGREEAMTGTPTETPTETLPFFKPSRPIPDEEDLELQRTNADPVLATRRLRDLVPLLEFLDCRVDPIGADETVLSMPLLETAMNQNGTQQAAVFYLIADYALGVGMFGALPGVYNLLRPASTQPAGPPR